MRVGVVGDIHLPFTHPLYLQFCLDVFEAWGVDHVHLIGDVVDLHALSFYDIDPNGHSPEREAELAQDMLRDWVAAFPSSTVSIGNHDNRHYRRAQRAGVPDRYLKTYCELWDAPGWKWDLQHRIDGVLYEHGTGSHGKDAAFNRAKDKRTSLVMGHTHTHAGVKWHANEYNRIFGLNVGCGIDCSHYAFNYGKHFATRPVLGCGIVLDGVWPYFEPMPIGKGERYHRKRA